MHYNRPLPELASVISRIGGFPRFRYELIDVLVVIGTTQSPTQYSIRESDAVSARILLLSQKVGEPSSGAIATAAGGHWGAKWLSTLTDN